MLTWTEEWETDLVLIGLRSDGHMFVADKSNSDYRNFFAGFLKEECVCAKDVPVTLYEFNYGSFRDVSPTEVLSRVSVCPIHNPQLN